MGQRSEEAVVFSFLVLAYFWFFFFSILPVVRSRSRSPDLGVQRLNSLFQYRVSVWFGLLFRF